MITVDWPFDNCVYFSREIDDKNKLFMVRPSSESCIDIQAVLKHHPIHLIQNILPIHALSGCVTVSNLFGIGKTKLAKTVVNNPELATNLEVFLNPQASDDDIYSNGKQVLSALYVAPTRRNTNFNDLRPLWVTPNIILAW